MKVFDGHSDIWYDAFLKNHHKENILLSYHIPRLKAGNICGVNAAVWTNPKSENPMEKFMQMIAIRSKYMRETENNELIFAENGLQINKAIKSEKIFVISSIEGLIGIGNNIDFIATLYDLGFRVISLTWNEANTLAAGCGCNDDSKGLSDFGRQAVKIIENIKIVLDVSHLSEKSFWDVVKIAQKPFIATHSNAYSLCPVPRNLKDDQIKAIAESGGLIGISALPQIVDRENPSLEKVVKHIIYVTNLIGVDHICLGFDFFDYLTTDNIIQNQKQTTGLEDVTKVPTLIECLKKSGFDEKDIEKIALLNFLNFLQKMI